MSDPQCGGPFLPRELLWEILSCLPVKALMRFRCVCKSWNSLISDSTFVKLHLQRSSTNTSLLYTLYHYHRDDNKGPIFLHCCSIERLLENPSSTFDDGALPLKSTDDVIGVCNGLVCLTTTTFEGAFRIVWVQFWNPATRLRSQKSCILQSDRNSDPHETMGLGYDDSKDTYKVVAVTVTLETEVIVHCMGDSRSKKVASWSRFRGLEAIGHGQYVAGTLNWMAATSIQVGNPYVIFSFDLRNETYRCLMLPHGSNIIKHNLSQHLGVLRGCLCFFHCEETTHFSVWQMKEFGMVESWTMLLKVCCEGLRIFNSLYQQFPLCITENGDFLLLASNQGERFQVIMYNRRDNRLEKIHSRTNAHLLNFFDHGQSLVLPY